MYGKAYESMYEGSMVGAGAAVFAVWNYCIAKNREGFVELNPRLVGFILGETEGVVREAINKLCSADTESRSKECEGRRLVKDGEYQYRMVNWGKYFGLKSATDQREYNRLAQARHRAKLREVILSGKEAEAYESAKGGHYSKRRKVVENAGACEGGRKALQEGLSETNGGTEVPNIG